MRSTIMSWQMNIWINLTQCDTKCLIHAQVIWKYLNMHEMACKVFHVSLKKHQDVPSFPKRADWHARTVQQDLNVLKLHNTSHADSSCRHCKHCFLFVMAWESLTFTSKQPNGSLSSLPLCFMTRVSFELEKTDKDRTEHSVGLGFVFLWTQHEDSCNYYK